MGCYTCSVEFKQTIWCRALHQHLQLVQRSSTTYPWFWVSFAIFPLSALPSLSVLPYAGTIVYAVMLKCSHFQTLSLYSVLSDLLRSGARVQLNTLRITTNPNIWGLKLSPYGRTERLGRSDLQTKPRSHLLRVSCHLSYLAREDKMPPMLDPIKH